MIQTQIINHTCQCPILRKMHISNLLQVALLSGVAKSAVLRNNSGDKLAKRTLEGPVDHKDGACVSVSTVQRTDYNQIWDQAFSQARRDVASGPNNDGRFRNTVTVTRSAQGGRIRVTISITPQQRRTADVTGVQEVLDLMNAARHAGTGGVPQHMAGAAGEFRQENSIMGAFVQVQLFSAGAELKIRESSQARDVGVPSDPNITYLGWCELEVSQDFKEY